MPYKYPKMVNSYSKASIGADEKVKSLLPPLKPPPFHSEKHSYGPFRAFVNLCWVGFTETDQFLTPNPLFVIVIGMRNEIVNNLSPAWS